MLEVLQESLQIIHGGHLHELHMWHGLQQNLKHPLALSLLLREGFKVQAKIQV